MGGALKTPFQRGWGLPRLAWGWAEGTGKEARVIILSVQPGSFSKVGWVGMDRSSGRREERKFRKEEDSKSAAAGHSCIH